MPEQWEQTLAAARRGEPAAWAGLYELVSGPVHGYLRGQYLSDPDDVAGEVLLQVVRDLASFDGDERSFRAWVLTIAHHRVVDAARRRERRRETPTPDEQLTEVGDRSSAYQSNIELSDVTESLLADLSPDQRTVVLLRLLGDLSVEEVARSMRRRPGAVRSLQNRALARMRERLPEHFPPT